MAVVEIIKRRTAKDPLLMHLLRCLVFYAASFGFPFLAEHVSGAINTAADAISRNNIQLFLSLVPQMPCVSISQPVLDLLVTRRPNWGSCEWTTLFSSSLTRAPEQPPEPCIYQLGGSTACSADSIHCPSYHSLNTPSANLQQSYLRQ